MRYLNKKRPARVLVISDMHVGDAYGLLPKGYMTVVVEGTTYRIAVDAQ